MAAVGRFDPSGEVYAQCAVPNSASAGDSQLIVLPTPTGEKTQALTVIDPRQQSMAMYHVDLSNGKITLLSVRNIHYDLQMTEFNGVNPLPREIRLQLEQR